MSTPTPVQTSAPAAAATPAPTPVPLTPAQAVNGQLISQLLTMQGQLEVEIDYLSNAAANLADRQAKLAAVQQQLSSLGYVAAPPPSS